MESEKIQTFDIYKDPSSIGQRWTRWFRQCDLLMQEKDISTSARKRAGLLRRAGNDVQEIAEELENRADEELARQVAEVEAANAAAAALNPPGVQQPVPVAEDVWVRVQRLLNERFLPKRNEHFEKYLFQRMQPTMGEAAESYIQRLRQQAKLCDFDGRLEREIRDQYINTCPWPDLQAKLVEDLLEKGRDLTLNDVQTKAEVFERARYQQQSMTTSNNPEVNAISKGSFHKTKSTTESTERRCFGCDKTGHFVRSDKCPAKGKTCGDCGGSDHFTRLCKASKSVKEAHKKGNKKTPRKVRNLTNEEESQSGTESEGESVNSVVKAGYAFTVQAEVCAQRENLPLYPVTVGGVSLSVLIDSGANTNCMGAKYYQELKGKGFEVIQSQKKKGHLALYNGQKAKYMGVFTARVRTKEGREVTAEFEVLEGNDIPIMCRKDCENLGLLVVAKVCTVSVSDMERLYPQAFQGVGKLKGFKLHIPVDPNVQPKAQPLRRVAVNRLKHLEKLLFSLLDMDIIERVNGPTPRVSPAHIVPKGAKDWRLCVDMREANRCVLRERYPVKTLDELLLTIGPFQKISKTDFKLAFHQLELDEESRELSTFSTPMGIFRYKRLWFGMLSAQEYLVKTLSLAFLGAKGVTIAFDDAVITGKTPEEHDLNLHAFMKLVCEKGLTLNRDKCKFGVTEVVFLGHILSPDGVRPSEGTQSDVVNFRSPINATEVHSFLGLVNFAARYVPQLASLGEPLRKLCKKDVPFEWDEEKELAFSEIKKCLSRPPTLCFYDKEAPTAVVVDASPVGLGACLLQVQGRENSCARVVKFCSRALSDRERRYSQTEKEALAAVWACEHLMFYLLDKEFDLITDCKALEFIFSPQSKPCMRLERWVMRLQAFNYKVVHKPGKTNIADPLSRMIPDVDKKSKKQQDGVEDLYVLSIVKELVPCALTLNEIVDSSAKDPVITEVMKSLRSSRWQKELRYYELLQEEFCEVEGILTRGKKIVMPKELQPRVLALAHEGHLAATSMKARLRSKVWWKGMDKDAEKFASTCRACQFVGNPDPPQPMVRTEMPEYPWQYIGIDHMGPLPSKDYLFVIVDYYSRFYEVEVTRSTSAAETVRLMRPHFARYGVPEVVLSDNAKGFRDETVFNQFLKEEGTAHEYSTPLWPQANGEVERCNKSLLKRLKLAQLEKKDWKVELHRYLAAYRSTPHATTGQPPAKLFFGNRIVRTKIPELREWRNDDGEVRERDKFKKAQGKLYADQKRGAEISKVKEGDQVIVKQTKENKLSTPFNPTPMRVIQREGSEVTFQNPETGGVYTRNSSAVKVFQEPEEEPVENEGVAEGSAETSPGPRTEARQDDQRTAERGAETQPRTPVKSARADPETPKGRPKRERKQPAWFKDFEMEGTKQ